MTVAAERDILTHGTEMCLAVRANREVGVVTGVMAFRIFQSMLLSVRVEMRPRRLEVGGVALRVLMKVDGMFAGGRFSKLSSIPIPGADSHRIAVPTTLPWASLS